MGSRGLAEPSDPIEPMEFDNLHLNPRVANPHELKPREEGIPINSVKINGNLI